jgi:hypothetical protein
LVGKSVVTGRDPSKILEASDHALNSVVGPVEHGRKASAVERVATRHSVVSPAFGAHGDPRCWPPTRQSGLNSRTESICIVDR